MNTVELFGTLDRMRRCETYCDVVLLGQVESAVAEAAGEAASEARGVWAHRVILASASPYFLAMFMKLQENQVSVIIVKGVDPATLQAVVDYIYSPGSLSVTAANAQALLSAASLLEVEGLRDSVFTNLEQSLAVDNVLQIRAFAEQHACTGLTAAASSFIHYHFVDILRADEILGLSKHALTTLLDSFKASYKDDMLDAVLRWTQHLPKERQRHWAELQQHVRLPVLPQEKLADSLTQYKDLMNTSSQCQGIDSSTLDVIDRSWSRQPASPTLLVVGGWTTKPTPEVVCYDLLSSRWASAAALPHPRYCAGAAVIDGRVYLVGGHDGNKRLNSVVVYDVSTDTWTEGPSLRTARDELGVASLGGVLYAAGGWDAAGKALSLVEALDPREGVWRSIADMSTGRAGVGVAALGGMLYAVGGYSGNQYLNTVERYDPVGGRSAPVDRMREKRCDVGVGVVENTLYVIGGHDGLNRLRSMELYNPGSGWKCARILPTARSRAPVAAHAGRLYVPGGWDDQGVRLKSVGVFEPATEVWSELLAAMPVARSSAAVVVIN